MSGGTISVEVCVKVNGMGADYSGGGEACQIRRRSFILLVFANFLRRFNNILLVLASQFAQGRLIGSLFHVEHWNILASGKESYSHVYRR